MATDPSHLLTWMTFAPLIGAGVILALKSLRLNVPNAYRWVALAATGAPLAMSALLWKQFDPTIVDAPQFVHHFVWVREFNIEYFVGVDGISVLMVILTALISFIACIASFGISKKPAG